MELFKSLSRILPLFIFPLGLACILVILGTFLLRERWQKVVLIAAVLLLFLGGNRWVSLRLAQSLEWEYVPPRSSLRADVIIILASGNYPADYPRAIPEVGEIGDRLIYGAYLYQQGVAPLILHSGGSPNEDIPTLLGIMGVPEEAVILETSSHNTYENAVECQKIITEKGFQRIVLVTSAAHMPRAVGVFKRLGIEVIPAPTGYSATHKNLGTNSIKSFSDLVVAILPDADNLKTTTRMLSEYIGIFIYKLRGWI